MTTFSHRHDITLHAFVYYFSAITMNEESIMKIFACTVLLTIGIFSAYAQEQGIPIYCDGEYLQYKVSWSFIRLGTITIRCQRAEGFDGDHYWLHMDVKSAPMLPFINIDEHNQTLIEAGDGMSRIFRATHTRDGEGLEIQCIYEPECSRATFWERKVESNEYLRFDIMNRVEPYLDGPTLFYFARRMIHSNKKYVMPTMINGKVEKTILDFTGPVEWMEVDAFEQPVKTRRYEGTALWEGGTGAGLSGTFYGWLTDDSAAVTVRADMEVLLGSVVIELEEYIRPGWNPPLALQASN